MTEAVALTFDDGPHSLWTPAVLDALDEAEARATFFVVAPLARRWPALIHRMRESGHEVAFHCTEHVRHDALTAEEIEEDTRSGLRTLNDLGETPIHWRTPWGLVNSTTKEVARAHGLRLAGWTADTGDWRGDPAAEMLARVDPGVSPGAVVLMHDGLGTGAARTGCAETVRLVRPVIALARSRGLEPVPLRELRGPFPDQNPDFLPGQDTS